MPLAWNRNRLYRMWFPSDTKILKGFQRNAQSSRFHPSCQRMYHWLKRSGTAGSGREPQSEPRDGQPQKLPPQTQSEPKAPACQEFRKPWALGPSQHTEKLNPWARLSAELQERHHAGLPWRTTVTQHGQTGFCKGPNWNARVLRAFVPKGKHK